MNQIFINNLKKYMKSCGINHMIFAENIGDVASNLFSWTRGKHSPSVRNLKRLADCIGVTMDELYNKELTFEPGHAVEFNWVEPEDHLLRNLRLLMADRNMKIGDLCEVCDVKRRTVGRILSGEPVRFLQIGSVMPIANHFGLTLDEIMYEEVYLRVR